MGTAQNSAQQRRFTDNWLKSKTELPNVMGSPMQMEAPHHVFHGCPGQSRRQCGVLDRIVVFVTQASEDIQRCPDGPARDNGNVSAVKLV